MATDEGPIPEDELDNCGSSESGPFCVHWNELGDCDLPCGTCGHRCHEGTCDVDGCKCEKCTDGRPMYPI